MDMTILKSMIERNELGLYKLSELLSMTFVDDAVVVCYRVVGAEPHSAHVTFARCAIVKAGRITHAMLLG